MVNPTSHLASLDFLSVWRRNVSDLVTGNGEAEAPDAADVQNKYNDQRSTIRRDADGIGFDGEYRGKAVTGDDEFDKPSLSELRTKVDAINLDTVNGLVDAWKQVSTRNSTSLDEFRKQIARGTSPDVWSGAAAAAAAETVAGYDTIGKRVTAAAALTSSKLDELRTGLEPTKNLVPYPPEHRSGGANLHSWFAGRGWRNDDVAERNAKAEAVRVLRTVYAPVIHESDTGVPVIPVPKPVNATDPGTGGGATRPDSGGPATTVAGATQPETTDPATTNPAAVDDGTTDDSATDDTSTEDSTTDDSTTDDSTTPQSTVPASTTPSGTTPGSGGPAGSGGGAPGMGGSGGGTPGGGTPGGAVPGSPSTGGAASAAVRAGGSGAAGRSGMPGMMSPGARGGGKDDESTKGIPDYLVTQEHGDELTGLGDLPPNVPPVIGSD
ncbi:hypothetical protein [Nocardia asteroides]|uniref:hypothetical protein n=1 Tax=Nocardia asteroides TaxID=1824 RepID=UPI0036615104